MVYAYIIRSKKTLRYYVGSTQDVENRLLEHNSGECRSTRGGIPWELLWTEGFKSRSDATLKERQIKGRGIGRFLESLPRKQPG